MARHVYVITHPDVLIDPAVPVPDWPLSPRGRERMRASLRLPWMAGVRALFSSTERKAVDGAEILAAALDLPITQIADLGENDRSSTGYLPKLEFETMADAFFARPQESVRGWERAIDAQRRIVAAMEEVLRRAPVEGDVAVVSHGGVGALYLCHLQGHPIGRDADQPPTNGGNYYAFSATDRRLLSGWTTIDQNGFISKH
ncbi:histidine phosphatase family protein [Inquilinus limosus]|uniref:Histidine phosphatase family protein n=1 Tax=Inquilinus limosus TaxID=171674 RepID=A0A211ZPA4_9PROT|nr:histidine phosphatase family protein [Inquilinus limosus]OWJ67016.1 histidine phosphatase family protein [Inquilinus limosus]